MIFNIHQKISLAFATMILIYSMYDVLFHLLLGIAHILFESAEYIFDLVIEHLFDMGNHETQIMFFYILMFIIGGVVYRLYRRLPICWRKLKQHLQRQKVETLAQWQTLSMLWKMAWWSFFITAANCWLFLT